jgi:hypothetical protein
MVTLYPVSDIRYNLRPQGPVAFKLRLCIRPSHHQATVSGCPIAMTKLELANAQLLTNLSLSAALTTLLIAYLPSSVFLRLIAFGLISSFYCDSFRYPTGDWFIDYVIGCTIASQATNGFYLVFLANPLDNFRHENDVVSPRKMPCFQRLSWAHRVVNGPIGIGWNYNVRLFLHFNFIRLTFPRFSKSIRVRKIHAHPSLSLAFPTAWDIIYCWMCAERSFITTQSSVSQALPKFFLFLRKGS